MNPYLLFANKTLDTSTSAYDATAVKQIIFVFLSLILLLCLFSCNANGQIVSEQAQETKTDTVDTLSTSKQAGSATDTAAVAWEDNLLINIVETMPAFPGGQQALLEWLYAELKYPPMAKRDSVEGTVYVGFTVGEDGSIADVHIKRGLPEGGAGCDAEALRLVNSMPQKWTPGKRMGKALPVRYTLPIKFRLD